MRYGIVTVESYIECGLRLGLGAVRTLAIYREQGGKIRTAAFMERWRAIAAEHDDAGVRTV